MQDAQPTQKLSGFDPTSIFENSPGFEAGEGEFIVGGSSRQVLGRMAACFMGFCSHEGLSYFRGITVIAPPLLVWDHSDEDINSMLLKGLEDMGGRPLSADGARKFLETVTVHRCQQLDMSEVVDAVESSANRQIILIAESSKFRDTKLKQEWALGRSGTLLPEDIWVPHASRLAAACLTAAKPLGSVVVFSAIEEAPVKDESIQQLNSVDMLYPIIIEYKGDPDIKELLSEQVPRWVALAAGGFAQKAFEELDNAGLEGSVKQQIALQLAARAGDSDKVREILRARLADLEKLSSDDLARLGRMAHMHGDSDTATHFFAAAVDDLSTQMWLETALLTLTSLGEVDLVERCWTRLQALFPRSLILQENREFRLLVMCDANPSADQAPPSRVGFADFHIYIADALRPKAEVNYVDLSEKVILNWPSQEKLAAICVAFHALRRQDLSSALNFAIAAAEDPTYETQAVRVLLGTLRRMLLLESRPTEGMETYKSALLYILRYLGSHPEEASFRASLASAFTVEMAGGIGLPMLASFAFEVSALGAQLEAAPSIPNAISHEEFMAFLFRCTEWMEQQTVIELGVTRLPADIVRGDAARFILPLEHLMQEGVHNHETPDDIALLERSAYILGLLHPHAPEYSADLEGLRLLAAKFSLTGQPQHARNIAEQMLLQAGGSLKRQRLAWSNYADIYQRARSPVDALIGLTCAALTDATLSPAALFQEAYTLLRVTRDLHLYDIARAILPVCKKLYELQAVGEMGQQRLVGIEIALDTAQANNLDEEGLFALLERARAHCDSVMQGRDELLSSAAQFLQIAGAVERSGYAITPEAVVLRQALSQRLGADTTTFLKAISAAFPSAEEVVWLHNRLESANNSEDIPADQMSVVIAAHRLLLPQTPEISEEDAAVAVELLSDHAVELSKPAGPLDVGWPARFIRDLSAAGLGVLMLATDASGELVAILAEQGQMRVLRPDVKERSFESRLKTWTATYPYQYGLIERDEGNEEFYLSMQDFELPMPDTDKVLVVAQPALQQLAYNLVLLNAQFAGASKAIGLAPSLTWFDSIRQRASATSNKRHAWISCSLQSEAYGTMDMIFSRLAPLLGQHGFATDTSGRIPDNLHGASIAVVTAHGQLTSEHRYIHSIADEQELTESPLALARALAGVELVILFVCSGGRVDRHPMTNTTVSLPKMLLDRGCRAVIASPWPLTHAVPGNWLERFLEAWETGNTVVEANFKANLYVQERLGPEPALCHAMTVYGDVLLTK
jgi:hypothetical protein